MANSSSPSASLDGTPIVVAAAIIRNEAGEFLHVHKAGTTAWMFPGGKFQPGETPEEALCRELAEEVSLTVEPGALRFRGIFSTAAVNEAGRLLVAHVYEVPSFSLDANLQTANEIAELKWVDLSAAISGTNDATTNTADSAEAEALAGDSAGGPASIAPLSKQVAATIDRSVNTVAVYLGASEQVDEKYKKLAYDFGRALAQRNITLVFGGSGTGLMKCVTDGVLDAGGHAVGVITQSLADMGVGHPDVDYMYVTETLAERRALMIDLADAFTALPGGVGTLDEITDVWASQQLGYHDKPFSFFGEHYWQPFVTMAQHMASEGFIRQTSVDGLILENDAEALLSKLEESLSLGTTDALG